MPATADHVVGINYATGLARDAVQEALKKDTLTPEMRERLEKLADAVNKPDTGGEWIRPLRAVEALERIATPDAVAHELLDVLDIVLRWDGRR